MHSALSLIMQSKTTYYDVIGNVFFWRDDNPREQQKDMNYATSSKV